MKRKRLYSSIICLIVSVIFAYFIFGREKVPQSGEPERVETRETEKSLVRVARVVDGDTIELETGERVRYIGIDTPETKHPKKEVECFGREAGEKNKELVEGKYVRLEIDVSEKDRYGRLLRYVYTPNFDISSGEETETFINLELVKLGFAYAVTFPPDVKYQGEFLAAQKYARENKSGLWKECK